ncbi:MAG TPA: phospholipase A [Thiobacillaceae bacterium]|nr:phospholipase A [Thiobacillaceae bacterium]
MPALLVAGLAAPVQAASIAEWEACSTILNDVDRLVCYDAVSGRSQPEAELPAAPPAPATPARKVSESAVYEPAEPEDPRLLSALSRHWELDADAKQGAFLFRAHRGNYLLPIKYSSSPSSAPFQETILSSENFDLDPIEAELQLSFKIKGMEGVFGHRNADLWFGYTVTSFWQAYNSHISSPFRETNYEPEAMLVYRTNYEIAGFRGRFLNLGISHQSNGRGATLSRSWNRVYAQFGFERGDLSVLIRPWYRIPESAEDDDNPDIEDYLGHGDVQFIYNKGRQAYSLMLRNNFRSKENHGAMRLSWSFPLYGRLKGYVQYFDGYGESLIDYNHSQQSFGIGLSLTGGI